MSGLRLLLVTFIVITIVVLMAFNFDMYSILYIFNNFVSISF